MKNIGYYNGKFDELEKMTIPMLDRACYFGDGVYDATYSRNYIIYDLDKHIDRFFNSAKLLEINIQFSKEETKNLLYSLLRKLDSGNNFVYWQVSRGSGIRNHLFPDSKENLFVYIYPKEILDINQKVNLITMQDTRFFHCNIKTLNLIPSVIASERAREKNCFETIFHRNGRVTECAHSNIHIIKEQTLITAPTDNLILPGITRANLIALCKDFDIAVQERPFYLEEMMNADEILITSVGTLCLSAEQIDGQKVGGKAPHLVKKLSNALLQNFYSQTNI